jgi:hypothetical protein
MNLGNGEHDPPEKEYTVVRSNLEIRWDIPDFHSYVLHTRSNRITSLRQVSC